MKIRSPKKYDTKVIALLFAIIFCNTSSKTVAQSIANQNSDQLEVCIFSKHLQFLDYDTLGKIVAEMGFDGIDLTVRTGGHVEPATVKTDLPKAVAESRKGGTKVVMI